ncbi:MAG TPA: hypothetical protein VHB79_17725 [Polyangiaceae bacterium]|nr:hypothetical protein [Polyangiaceae bacterium]
MRGTSLDEIRRERDYRLAALERGKVAEPLIAHTHCVIAELMRRVGDARADDEYQAAIAKNPREPAYELWYGRYLMWSRGAGAPLSESAELHYSLALEKLKGYQGMTQVGSTAAVAREWTTRNLLSLYQEDGLALLPYGAKAYPFGRTNAALPQLSLAVTTNVARDTNDLWEQADVRRFSAEAQVARQRLSPDPLSREQLRAIARAPLRYDGLARLRLRQSWLGVLDGHYRQVELKSSQITAFDDPTRFNDVTVKELGADWRRTLPLYPAFDVTLEAGAAAQDRTGLVEGDPGRKERIYIYRGAPTVSRFVGPDKLTLTGAYVYFDIQDNPTGALDERPRERVLRAAAIDYAFYRPFVLPQVQDGTFASKRVYTRGLHFFATVMSDDERFGTTVVRKTTYGGGSVLKGWQGFDFMLMGNYFRYATEVNRDVQPQLGSSQWRSNVRIMKRLIDEEITPGMPPSPLTSLELVIPLRHDLALSGPNDYENVRGGLELWGKLLAPGLRGSTFLLNASVEAQYFYHLDKVIALAQVGVRLGWPSFGTLPAFF